MIRKFPAIQQNRQSIILFHEAIPLPRIFHMNISLNILGLHAVPVIGCS
jgi:hypothetical protein